jgi:hypothetical protein
MIFYFVRLDLSASKKNVTGVPDASAFVVAVIGPNVSPVVAWSGDLRRFYVPKRLPTRAVA